ncbi:MAG TPA: crosslink repair DNA glycosylase YcaQ family protein, partial [Pseudonocardiaceae bacterium]
AALRREEADGRVYWCGAGRGAPDPGPVAHLLQPYDEYVVGYAAGEDGSRRALDVAGVVRREPRFHCVLLVGGQLAGFWRRTVSRRLITVEVDLMRPLTAAERAAVDAAVAGFGAAHGLDATWA